ncbi:prenylcysteine oxidase 1 precursor [Danio rerio]|uniref:Prenylcysteine oxidase 1 n=1 Tax=Danio rerio TaxID=7955 RepID=Q568K1_DANRE|nr:prenylcysteine oxidase 1 precursor [Danio rerio]AAH92824.1 Zgc:110246 [Danio rerio]AAI64221.1 Zgc:110246 protein [Danio rerio]|eukprot:NP_001017626.1 prenylcysteine oxidase 1 precursor [Danio rerio]
MALRHLSVKAFLFLGLCQIGRRGLASAPEVREAPRKIAIIGGGIGGTATAFFLRQEFGPAVKIEVFEAGTVGGRLATENIGGHEYETGGSIIHPLNLHMKHFLDKLGLSVRADVSSKMAIFDGKELTFEESDWYLVNVIRMLWRYGLNFIRMHMWVEGILDKFMRIYQYQQFSYSFSSVEKMLHAMGGDSFLTLVNQTLEEAMLAEGFSQVFLNDIVTPVTRVNYGQTVRINGFVGAVSLAGASSGLWAVDGGNKLVCSGLLYHSKAEVVPARVTAISMKTRPSKTGPVTSFYEVNYIGESGAAHSTYDIVVVATPLHQGLSDINFSGFSPPIPSHFPGRYHQTVATLVHGLLNLSYLGTTLKPEDFYISDVLTLDKKASEIHSLSSLDPVKIPKGYTRSSATQSKVWKIFSSQPLSQKHLQQIFLSQESVFEKRWLAYPSYSPPQRRTPPFILHDRLYYLNAVEWAASAMEMSAISARNLALLAHHRWYEQTAKIDQEDLHTRLRGEL